MGDTITVTLAGVVVSLQEGSFQLDDELENRSTLSFTIIDSTGNVTYPYGTQVSITSALHGTLYTGLVYQDTDTNLYPQPHRTHLITCMDNHYFADKLWFKKADYAGMNAGDIVVDLLNTYLSAEGITAQYAYRRDTTTADFGTGTLSNVVGASNVGDGDLELSSAGSSFTKTESVASDWNAGTLTNTAVVNNQLVLASNTAIHLTGTSQQGANNNYAYIKIWAGSQSIASGDSLRYGIWISSTSPAIIGGVDFTCTDGTTARSQPIYDLNGLSLHPGTDLSGYANDQRYYRQLDITPLAGKTIANIQVALEGDPNGTYHLYIDTIQQFDNTSTLKQSFFTGSLQTNTQISNIGYSNVSLTTVTAYYNTGTRVSPAYSIAGPGMPSSSLVSWIVSLSGNGPNKIPYFTLESSIDGGATWQFCTNHAALPDLLTGANLSGKTLTLRQTLNVAGPDPTITPALTSNTVTISPSYAYTKTDAIYSESTATDWNGGTPNNTRATGNDLTINALIRNYAGLDFSSQTLYGGTPVQQGNLSTLALRCDGTSDIRCRLDWMGQWQNFTFEADIQIQDSVGNYGIVYRTTGWQNNNNTHAYAAYIDTGGIHLERGTNSSSGTGTATVISVFSLALASATWYRFKVVVSGSNHKVYLNDVLYINVTDSTYSAQGYIGLRHYNSSGSRHSGFFNNPGVAIALGGSRVSPSLSLNSVGTVGKSLIAWYASVPSNTSLLVETSIDGGSTWQTATNNATIPLLTAGTNVSGKNLQWRTTLNTNNANATPAVHGISVWVVASYNASGNRISPSLSLAGVTRAGSVNAIWNALIPTNTTFAIDSSINGGTTWTQIGNTVSGSAAVAGITSQPTPQFDTFTTNTSANYTSATNGGATGTWSYDLVNTRVTGSGGSQAVFTYNALSFSDGYAETDMDTADSAGLGVRWVDANNSYYAVVCDASAGSNPNTIRLFRRSGGTSAQVGSTFTISFVRGTYHRIHLEMSGSTIFVNFDGVLAVTYTDGSPIAGPGKAYLYENVQGRFYSFRVQQYGQTLAGVSALTRCRLGSTDPTVTPQLLDVTLSAHNPNIDSGAFVDTTNYQYTKTITQCVDDLAKRSTDWWYIDKAKTMYMQKRTGTPATWCLQSTDVLVGSVSIANDSPLYRNRSVIVGGVGTIANVVETRMGDGVTQTWTMTYPLASAPTILQDGQPATVGVLNVDTGKQYYYQVGSAVISQDKSLTPLSGTSGTQPAQTFSITYTGQKVVVAQYDDTTEQTTYAALEGGSGIVEVLETIPTLSSAAATSLASARVGQYEVRGRTLTFDTLHYGLAPGQLLPVFLPQHKILNGQFLVRKVTTVFNTLRDSTELTRYTIIAIEGPNVGAWERLFIDQ